MNQAFLAFSMIFFLLTGYGQGQDGTLTAATPAPTAAALTQPQGELAVVLSDANQIRVQEAEGTQLSFGGPAELFQYAVEGPVNGVTTVRITGEKGADREWETYTLTVPKAVYGVIRVEAEDSGVAFFPQAADYVVTGEDSAVSVMAADDYEGGLSMELTDCAVSLDLIGEMKNLSLALDARDCAIHVPENWDYRADTPYSITRGTGGAELAFTFRDCAVDITQSGMAFVSRYAQSGGSSAMSMSGGVEMLFGDMSFSDWKGSEMSRWKAAAKPNTLTAIKTIPAGGVTGLRINANLCAVVLEPSVSGGFELAYQGVDDSKSIAVSTEVEDGLLTVTAEGTLKDSLYLNVTPDFRVNCVRLLVPEGVLKSLTIDCGEGIVATEGMVLPAVTGVTERGIVNLNGDKVTEPVTMSSRNGDIQISAGAVSAPVTVETQNGHAEVEAAAASGDIALTAGNGSVEAKIGDAAGQLTLTAKNGSVAAEIGSAANARFQADNGSVEVSLGAITGQVWCGAANGRLEMELTSRPSDLTLRLEGGWSGNDWNPWKDDRGEKEEQLTGLPAGWRDGMVLGSGRPTLTLSAARYSEVNLRVP